MMRKNTVFKGITTSLFLILIFLAESTFSLSPYDRNQEFMKAYQSVLSALQSKEESGSWPDNLQPVEELLKAEKDTTQMGTAVALREFISLHKDNPALRKELTSQLSLLLVDSEYSIRDYAARKLLDLNKEDFNDVARKNLETSLGLEPSKAMILLAEKVRIPILDTVVSEILRSQKDKPLDSTVYGSARWAAEIVRARRGDSESIKRILTLIENDKDPIHQFVRRSRDLEWIPQPEVIAFLKRFLDSEERLAPVIPNQPGPKVAQYAAVSLNRMLKGFPVNKLLHNFTEEELPICRDWMNQQTEWHFKPLDDH